MSTSLSKLVDNLSEGLHNNRCVDCKSYIDYMITKDGAKHSKRLIFRCYSCKKYYEEDFNKELIKRFANIYINFVMETLIIYFVIKKRSLS